MECESMGKLIQMLRKKNGMTQRDLAEQLNITDKAVSKWERDIARPDIDTLPKLATVLNTSVALLMGFEEKDRAECITSEKENETTITVPLDEHVCKNEEDFNPKWESYREHSLVLFRTGVVGFFIGSIGLLIAFMMVIINAGTFNFLEVPALVVMAIMCGLFFAGVPYGWRTISRWTSQWTIYGSVLILIFLFMFKIIGTFTIAMVGYPVILVYNLIRSQKSRRKVRVAFVVWSLIGIIYISFAIAIVILR